MRVLYRLIKSYVLLVFLIILTLLRCEVNGEVIAGGITNTDQTKGIEPMGIDFADIPKEKNQESAPSHPLIGVYGFIHGFVASVSVIIVSELGDKTFFIAAIMAMRYSRTTVFTGALGALALMTVLSCALGYATTIIPRKYTFYVSTALFACFGLKMLYEGYRMNPNEGQEEYEEVQAELKKKEEELEEMSRKTVVEDPESGVIRVRKQPSHCFGLISPIFMQSFTLTFLAEWGDRSQLTTIILATREDVIGVTLGGTLGHALCTGLAVIGGRLIAQRISVKTVTLVGGVVFLLFALSALIMGP